MRSVRQWLAITFLGSFALVSVACIDGPATPPDAGGITDLGDRDAGSAIDFGVVIPVIDFGVVIPVDAGTDSGVSARCAALSDPDAGIADSGVLLRKQLYFVEGRNMVRLAVGADGAFGASQFLEVVGTATYTFDHDSVEGRIYWRNAYDDYIRMMQDDGMVPRILASAVSTQRVRLVVDEATRTIVVAGSDGTPSAGGEIIRVPMPDGGISGTLLSEIPMVKGLSIDSRARIYTIIQDPTCTTGDRQFVRMNADGSAIRAGAVQPPPDCAPMDLAAAIDSEDGSTMLYFILSRRGTSGHCASGATSCVESARVSDGVGTELAVGERTTLADGDSRGEVIGLAVDNDRGHLYVARGRDEGTNTAFDISRTDLAGCGERAIYSFVVPESEGFLTYGFGMSVGP